VDMENELVRCRAGAPGLAVMAIKVGQLRTRSTGSCQTLLPQPE
jgi:hypothetical protein